MLSCREATRLMSEAQERPLKWHERAFLRFHNLMCKSCKHFEDQMAFLRRAAKRFARGDVPQDKSPPPSGS